jgi:hypothetical protein
METVNKLLAAFVLLILGAVMIATIAGEEQNRVTIGETTKTINIGIARMAGLNQINASKVLDVGNGLGTWRTDYSECIPQTIHLYNSSGTELADPTDYVYTYNVNSGRLTLKDTEALNNTVSNITTVTMNYCADGYMTSTWGQTALDVAIGLFALGLFGAALGFFYSIAKDTGMIN